MVKAPGPDQRIGALTQDMYVQRFNVAASRAKDQMWVFHSLRLSDLGNPEDMRFQLLDYCYALSGRADATDSNAEAVPEDRRVEPFDSLFEQRAFNRLVDRGYRVVPQFAAEGYRIDLVVVGRKARLAIECDGDAWHGPDAYERDLARQRDLERCGWRFFRIRESEFYVDRPGVLAQLWDALQELDIHPSGWTPDGDDPSAAAPVAVAEPERPVAEPEPQVVEPEFPDVDPDFSGTLDIAEPVPVDEPAQPVAVGGLLMEYGQFDGDVVQVATASRREMIDGLVRLVAAEGPVLGNRLHTAYVRASGAVRVTKLVAGELNKAISQAVREGKLVEENPLDESGIKPRTYRLPAQPRVRTRHLGPRSFEEVPPSELAALLDHVAERDGHAAVETAQRAVLDLLGLKRLTDNVRSRFAAVEAMRR
jgi:very-short-patch-repair endonuclease